jgi:uncharacterized protein (TIGR00251 family)
MTAWTTSAQGIVVTVRLTPRGGRDAVEGMERLADGRKVFAVRVRAPARGGAANAALIKLLAKSLAVPARDVQLTAGASARVKRVSIAGAGASLAAALEKICAMA